MRAFFFLLMILSSNCLMAGEIKNKYNISVCAIFKNEAKHLKEWIEFHRLIGVDHFYLYNVNSTDRYRDVLKKYIQEKIVTLIHWPDLSKNQNDAIWALGMQIPAYENAIKYTAIHETKWLIIGDIDEFLLPVNDHTLTELVEKYKEYPGIIIPRVFFDASAVDTLPKRNLVIEAIEMTAPQKLNPIKTMEKMIFKPDQCTHFFWPPYQFAFKNDQKPISLSSSEMRINRYLNRNIGLFDSKKPRNTIQMDPPRNENELNALLEAGYKVEDHTIAPFVPLLKKRMGY